MAGMRGESDMNIELIVNQEDAGYTDLMVDLTFA